MQTIQICSSIASYPGPNNPPALTTLHGRWVWTHLVQMTLQSVGSGSDPPPTHIQGQAGEVMSRLSLPRCDCIYWKTVITIMYRVGGSRESQYNCFKIANIYTLMKIKLTFIIKQALICTTRTTLSTRKNKRNVSTLACRVRASSSRSHCRCRIQTSKKESLSSQQLDHRYCRRSSYADVKDETVRHHW